MTASPRDRRAGRALRALALLPIFLATLAPSADASAPPQDEWIADETIGPWMQFLGRMHFALVHFPIGLLIAAGVIELFRSGRGRRPSTATLVCLGLGWLGAAVAAYSGWTYATIERHGHDPDGLLFWHRWGGVAVAGTGFLAWCAGLAARGRERGWAHTTFGLLLLVTTIGTGVVGHFGGSLVNGESFLTEPFEEAEKQRRMLRFAPDGPGTESPEVTASADAGDSAEPGAGDAAPPAGESAPAEGAAADDPSADEPATLDPDATIADFLDPPAESEVTAPAVADAAALYEQVDLLFDLNCYHCHGPGKAKGDLRLHAVDRLFERDQAEWVVVPGHPEQSELLRRISLPSVHEDLMPSDADPLLPEEIATVEAWIAALDPTERGLPADGGSAGAVVLGDWTEAARQPGGQAAGGGAEEAAADGDEPSEEAATDEGRDTPEEASASTGAANAAVEAALAALAERGAVANRLAEDAPDVDVVLGLLGEDVTDVDLALLSGLEPVLVSLDLSRTAVTDEGLAALSDFTRLERLRLDHTSVGDAGLAHLRELGRLEYLNLVGTPVTDQGLGELAGLETLERLYLWQTEVTDAGVTALAEALPALEIVRDVELPEPPPPLVVIEGETTFAEHAGPILAASCVDCHGPEEPAAGIRLDTFDALFEGEWAAWPVRPGEPESSRLLLAVQREPGTEGAMPKEGDPLTEAQIETLRGWVLGLEEVEAEPDGEDAGGEEAGGE